MKKLFAISLLCTAMLCGCSPNGGNEISETDVPETSYVAVTTESSVTTTTTTTTTAKETTVTKPAEEEIFLKPIPSEEPFEAMSCKITNDIMNYKEEDFPDKEALKFAREICYADEEIRKEIDENNIYAENFYLPEDVEAYKIKSAEDIMFDCGCTFDFDSDGEDESLISLRYVQPAMGSAMYGNILIYTDGGEYKILEKNIGSRPNAQVISAGEYVFLLSSTGSGALWYSYDIYSFESGMPEKVTDYDDAIYIYYQKCIFYYEIKHTGTFAFVLCEDGKFRQLGREKISREDFEAHVENGGTYLDSLAEIGEEITDIYTYGYYNYELYGEGFRYDVYGNFSDDNTFLTKRNDCDGVHGELYFTDEVIYGGDLWAVQKIN